MARADRHARDWRAGRGSVGAATAYAIANLQERGVIVVEPGTTVYEGMIIGENARAERHGRERHEGEEADQHARVDRGRGDPADWDGWLEPRAGGEFINDDELVEVTPKTIRLRKRILASNLRPKKSTV